MNINERKKAAAEEFLRRRGREYIRNQQSFDAMQRALEALHLDPANADDLSFAFDFALKMRWCEPKPLDIKIVVKQKPTAAAPPDPAKTRRLLRKRKRIAKLQHAFLSRYRVSPTA